MFCNHDNDCPFSGCGLASLFISLGYGYECFFITTLLWLHVIHIHTLTQDRAAVLVI